MNSVTKYTQISTNVFTMGSVWTPNSFLHFQRECKQARMICNTGAWILASGQSVDPAQCPALCSLRFTYPDSSCLSVSEPHDIDQNTI